jgi:NADP-dependent 3-hydroxy acid dehydrogenase YdfG
VVNHVILLCNVTDYGPGIGEALAQKLVEEGSRVIVVGRRKENLDHFVARNGSDKAEAFAFDITKLKEIPDFVRTVTTAHDDIDSVILNSGIQRRTGKLIERDSTSQIASHR